MDIQKRKDELFHQVNQEAHVESQHQHDQNSTSDVVGQATQFIQQVN